MKPALQFYFDFSSPYGYMGAMRIDELAARHERLVDWHPILLGVIFKTTEAKPLTMIPIKGEYFKKDFVRTAHFHQIPFNIPAVFPISTQNTARAMLWIEREHGRDSAIAFAKKALQAYFVEGFPIGETDTILNLAEQCGLVRQDLADGMQLPEIRSQLKTEVEEALAQGVFGAPFVIVDGEQFWGFDRFDQLEMHLKNGQD